MISRSNPLRGAVTGCAIGAVMLAAVIGGGCVAYKKAFVATHDAIDEVLDKSSDLPSVGTDTGSSSSTASTAFDLAAVQWYGQSYAGAKTDPALVLSGCSINGGQIRCSHTAYSWPERPMSNGGTKNAAAVLLWKDGEQWRGGRFDWVRTGGQKVKGLENIHKGYLGWTVPTAGAPCRYAWASYDGRISNIADAGVWK